LTGNGFALKTKPSMLQKLRKIEDYWKSKESKFWLYIGLFYIIFRLPGLFMPHWNFDEGVYLSLSSDLNRGFDIYTQTWDHKPPMLYWVYQFLLFLTSGNYFIIPLVNFFLGFVTIILVHKLSKYFLSTKFTYIATILVTFLLSLGFWEAIVFNAENLFIPLILLVFLLFLSKQKSIYTDLFIGVLIFVATTTKVHAVVELVGFFVGYLLINFSIFKRISIRYLTILVTTIALWVIMFASFALNNQLKFSFDSIFTYNSQYVDVENNTFATLLGVPIFNGKNNKPHRVGISDFHLRTAILISVLIITAYFTYKTKSTSKYILFLIWLSFSYYATTLSGRNYSHYLLQIVPAIAIGFGIIYENIVTLWQKNLSKLWSSKIFPLISAFLIWVYMVQSLVLVFAAGSGSSSISLDVFPVEVTYRDFYLNLASGSINKWQKEVTHNVYWFYPMPEIIQQSQDLTPEDGRFWHYSNISGLCYYSQRKCGYTSHLWFHLEGDILTKTLTNLNQRPPDVIFVDNDVQEITQITEFIKTNYRLEKSLPDVFSGSPRFEFWVLQ